jgi:membrane protein implicated in regulation of membrane protease activity
MLWFGLSAPGGRLANLAGVTSIPLQFLIFAVVSIGLTAASTHNLRELLSRAKNPAAI